MTTANLPGMFKRPDSRDYLEREPDPVVDSLAEGIHRITIEQQCGLVVEGADRVVVVDSFGTPGRARVYRRTISERCDGKPIHFILYTHDHVDATGYSELINSEATVVADQRAAGVIENRGLSTQRAPDRLLMKSREQLEIGSFPVELINPGPTHGRGNRALYFPEQQILFMKDTLRPDARYGLFPDYHLASFVSSMRELATVDFNRFVPGKDETMNPDEFEFACTYIESIMESAQRAFAEGVPVWERQAIEEYAIDTLEDRYGRLDGFYDHVGLSGLRVAHHFLMGGWGLEDCSD